jgi:ankyrin repeat protein
VTKIDDGRSGTSLHWAVVNLKADIRWVTLFLQHNANVNQLDNEGNSALHLLAADEDFSENDAAIATMLLEKGADASLLDNEGKTALQLAVEAKNDALLHVLNA